MSTASEFVVENGVLKAYVGPGGDVVIPEGVTEIGKHAFASFNTCGPVYSVFLPEGIEKIGAWAFDKCQDLRHINFPDSLNYIGNFAFSGCCSLSGDIEIKNPDCILGSFCFARCAIDSARIPVKKPAPPTASGGTFYECKNLRHVSFTTPLDKQEGVSGKKALPAILRDKNAFTGTALEAIYAPFCKIADLTHYKAYAAIGFAEMALDHSIAMDNGILAENKKYIVRQRKKLYAAAVYHPVLVRYMICEKIIPPEDVDICLKLASKQNQAEASALLMEYYQKEFAKKQQGV